MEVFSKSGACAEASFSIHCSTTHGDANGHKSGVKGLLSVQSVLYTVLARAVAIAILIVVDKSVGLKKVHFWRIPIIRRRLFGDTWGPLVVENPCQ